MINSTKNIALSLFAIVSMAILVNSCIHTYSQDKYHPFLKTREFKNMGRADQVAQCASCHQEIYDNERKGPHANSYYKLLEHREFVNSDRYDCDFYTDRINRKFEDCVGCHAPQNLPETMFARADKPGFIDSLLNEPHVRTPKREGEMLRMSGVDCLSCHYDGQKLVSLKHTKSAEDTEVGKQSKQKITQNNLNCYPCHFDVARNFSPEISIKRTGSALCINCHQEYDQDGKPTHYFYWQHDAPGKTNKNVKAVIDDFHFSLLPNKKAGEITWINTAIPHEISPGPEMILTCQVLDKDSAVLGTRTIRVNKKAEFDKEMYKEHNNNNLYGTVGDDVPLDGKPIKYPITIKNGHKANAFRITMMHKSQYWFPDSLGFITATKVYPISQP